MSVQKLIEAKGAFVSVASSHVTVDDVINQLEADNGICDRRQRR
jgi:hypothetical protein